MGILRRLREWREDSTGTLIGPNIDAESVDAGSVNTDDGDIDQQLTDPSDQLHQDTILGGAQSDTRMLEGGAWTWFNYPRAVVYNNVKYVGSVDFAGNIKIASKNLLTGEVTETILNKALEDDDHANPALCVRDDGRLLVTYAAHNGTTLRYRISDNPEDISSFGAEQTLSISRNSVSYTQLARLSDQGRIYLFYQDEGSNETISFRTSDDGGSTWSAATVLIDSDGNGEYWRIGTNGTDRIDFGMTDADGPQTASKNDVVHVYIKDGYVHQSDGTQLSALSAFEPLISHSDATTVYDSGSTGHDAWIHDCTTTNGKPQVIYAELRSETDHRWRYATFVNGQWKDTALCDAGENIVSDSSNEGYYSAGAALAEHAHGTAYLAAGDNDGSAVVRAVSGDDGETWTATTLASRATQNIRPAVPYAVDGDPNPEATVVWLRGHYDGFESPNFRTSVVSRPVDRPADTTGVQVVEDFSAGSLREYDGDLASFDISRGYGISGGFGIKAIGGADLMYSTDLSFTPQQGDTFAVDFLRTTVDGAATFAQWAYGVQDASNFYLPAFENGNLKLLKKSAGSFSTVNSVSVSGDYVDEIFTGVVDWQTDGTHDITIEDTDGDVVETLTATDSSYTSGQIGFRGQKTVYDNYRLR